VSPDAIMPSASGPRIDTTNVEADERCEASVLAPIAATASIMIASIIVSRDPMRVRSATAPSDQASAATVVTAHSRQAQRRTPSAPNPARRHESHSTARSAVPAQTTPSHAMMAPSGKIGRISHTKTSGTVSARTIESGSRP
jgi:hypothetical protein